MYAASCFYVGIKSGSWQASPRAIIAARALMGGSTGSKLWRMICHPTEGLQPALLPSSLTITASHSSHNMLMWPTKRNPSTHRRLSLMRAKIGLVGKVWISRNVEAQIQKVFCSIKASSTCFRMQRVPGFLPESCGSKKQ